MIPACPCDLRPSRPPYNPPGLGRINIRRGDWRSIRRALLTARDGEVALSGWRPGGTQDLALMVAEWWATLGEVLEFYNDEIANEAFLATSVQPAGVKRLVALLGYRPRPALAATARVAAVVAGRDAIKLPRGFGIESVPAPGKPPQTFELDQDTVLAPGGRIQARPPVRLTAPEAGVLLLEGRATGIAPGDHLRLRTPSGDHLLTVTSVEATSGGPVRTRLGYASAVTVSPSASAVSCRLQRATQTLPLWTFAGPAISSSQLHLAGLTRAVQAGDPVLVTAPGRAATLFPVTAAEDLVWYANPPAGDPAVPPAEKAIPVPHTRLTLAAPLVGWNASATTVHAGWVDVGRVVDQPPSAWSGSPATLEAVPPARFPQAAAQPVLVADERGAGVPAALSATANAAAAIVAVDPHFAGHEPLAPPLDVLTNLLSLTRGKTVEREVLGSGDARVAGQSFRLAKAPVTYRRVGAGYASTVTVLVDGEPWTEIRSFYGQPADAAVFALSETEKGETAVQFGDGINGRRLPTGSNNVVARYRYGASADSPAAAKLTRIPASYPGLTAILNPVVAGGGADAEPASAIRRYAPRSVLTFGRAVSVADFEAIAASAVQPHRVRAVWAWDEVRQRAAVTLHVAGGPDALAIAREAVSAAGDPHRPVVVKPARAVPLRLMLSLLVAPGYETGPIVAAAREALVGEAGLFSAARLGIGQPLFRSAVSASVLPIAGVLTILASTLGVLGGGPSTGALLRVQEGQWLELTAERLAIGCEVADG